MRLTTFPHKQDAMEGQLFLAELNRFVFSVFLLLDWLPYQDLKPILYD